MPPTIIGAEDEFVRKRVIVKQLRPIISTGIYASQDLIGVKLLFPSVVNVGDLGGFVHSLSIVDESDQKSAMNLILFSEDPTNTTFTDNAAFNIDSADTPKVLGFLPIAAGDYVSFAGPKAIATVRGLGFSFDLASAVIDLYGALVCGGTPTYAGTNDIIINLGMAQG